jgi:hypothetical protein
MPENKYYLVCEAYVRSVMLRRPKPSVEDQSPCESMLFSSRLKKKHFETQVYD